jgi:hypothetical protein
MLALSFFSRDTAPRVSSFAASAAPRSSASAWRADAASCSALAICSRSTAVPCSFELASVCRHAGSPSTPSSATPAGIAPPTIDIARGFGAPASCAATSAAGSTGDAALVAGGASLNVAGGESASASASASAAASVGDDRWRRWRRDGLSDFAGDSFLGAFARASGLLAAAAPACIRPTCMTSAKFFAPFSGLREPASIMLARRSDSPMASIDPNALRKALGGRTAKSFPKPSE